MKYFIYSNSSFFFSKVPDFYQMNLGNDESILLFHFVYVFLPLSFLFFVFVFTSTYIIKFSRYIIVETKGGKKYVIFSIEKFEGSLKKKYCISASINTIIYNSLFRLGLYYFQTLIYKRFHKDDWIVWSFEIFSYIVKDLHVLRKGVS